MTRMILKDKVAVVTGAASGIGKAIAKLYAQEGAKVVVSDINLAGAEVIVQEITADGGQAVAIKTDVSQVVDTDAMINLAVKQYGRLDILVNNTGIMDNMQPVEEVDEATWQLIIGVNVSGVLFACQKRFRCLNSRAVG